MPFLPRPVGLLTVLAIVGGVAASAQPVSYDIVYVKQPRFGDETNTTWPEVFHPAHMDPGADLMLLHPDGTEELLFASGVGSVTDPFLSFDAQWVYFSYFYDLSPSKLNGQRNNLPHDGADIFRIHLGTRVVEQLTFGEFTPNTGAGNWDETNPLNPPSEFNRLGYGILNLGPCPLPGGKIAFTSNRNGFDPPKGLRHRYRSHSQMAGTGPAGWYNTLQFSGRSGWRAGVDPLSRFRSAPAAEPHRFSPGGFIPHECWRKPQTQQRSEIRTPRRAARRTRRQDLCSDRGLDYQ